MSGWKPAFSPKVRRGHSQWGASVLIWTLASIGTLSAQELGPTSSAAPALERSIPGPSQRLEWAVESNDVAQVARILRDFPDLVQGPLPSGGSPLGLAVSRGSWETMDFLLDRGAGLQGRDAKGNQALLSGFLSGQIILARRLRQRGADLKAEDTFGNTALHLLHLLPPALWSSLLSEGFDPEARNLLGQTPFMRAVWEGNLSGADFLAKEGVNTAETDWLGRTARDYALRMGDEAMVMFLDTLAR